MKKIVFIFILTGFIFYGFKGFTQVTSNKNLIGFSLGFIPAVENGIYFGEPWDFNPKQEWSNPIQLFYEREIHQIFRIGGYVGFCKNNFSAGSADIYSFKKITLGVNGLLKYPKTKLHIQVGGFFGYGIIAANNWNYLQGVDFGGLVGPAFETNKWGVSLHIMAGYAPFNSKGTPEKVLLYIPTLALKAYKKF
ncbi:MAG: hypothetical protein H6Q25_1303 [Bacteroidetes bacterium]|nr:hypothetical protein [Bacteroidota bacterium]